MSSTAWARTLADMFSRPKSDEELKADIILADVGDRFAVYDRYELDSEEWRKVILELYDEQDSQEGGPAGEAMALHEQPDCPYKASAVIDVASPTELKSGSTSEEGNVLFAQRKVDWKPRSTARSYLAVETSQLFCSSNDPLHHTADDVGKFFQLDGSTSLFSDLFYHTGFCGQKVEARARTLQSSAMMVRELGLRMRDELLGWQQAGDLKTQSGLLLTGDMGVGKSCILNYLMACCQQSGWLVVAVPNAADWTLGLGAVSTQAGNEAYRVTDPSFFTDLPPELQGSKLHESPDASAHLLISTYLSQKAKLEQIAVKGAERVEYYAAAASDQNAGPTLADMLAGYVRDEHKGFSDFPIPVRPVYDFLQEVQLVTEFPTVIAVDGHNRWDQMATSCHWRSKVPLHATELLVPSILGDMHAFGSGMANGVMIGAISYGSAKPPRVPKALIKRLPPPYDFSRRGALPKKIRDLTRQTPTYSMPELQSALEFYALAGHMQNKGLEAQLRDGELGVKVGLLTAGVADDVYKICEQL